jgi:hypothetical protein
MAFPRRLRAEVRAALNTREVLLRTTTSAV